MLKVIMLGHSIQLKCIFMETGLVMISWYAEKPSQINEKFDIEITAALVHHLLYT